MNKWSRLLYQPCVPLREDTPLTSSKAHIELSLNAASEGMVLLKNESLLPLKKGTPVVLLGKGTYDYVKGGGGSGDVHPRYIRNLPEGLLAIGEGNTFAPVDEYYRAYVEDQYQKGVAPGMLAEPELPDNLLEQAAAYADTAIISISRFSGEGWDRPCGIPCGEDDPWTHADPESRMDKGVFMKGDFVLTDGERAVVEKAAAAFSHVVVLLNVGGVVETGWIKDDPRIGAALLVWQGGMEGGLAAAQLLYGLKNPCGRLPDTFPRSISDYPSTAAFHESNGYVHYTEDVYVGYRYFETIPGAAEKVCYPFGYGLSYTTFAMTCEAVEQAGQQLTFTVQVKNTGAVAGREVAQLYCAAPQGKLGKPARVLAAFGKTALLQPGESALLTLTVSLDDLASYDDTGAICRSAYVLEKGEYSFLLGANVECCDIVHSLTLVEDVIVRQLSAHLTPTSLPCRLHADGSYEPLPVSPAADLDESVIPKPDPYADNWVVPAVRGHASMLGSQWRKGCLQLIDVAEGRISMEDFISQLPDAALRSLLGGQPNLGVANTFGIGNLAEYGVPNMMTADGPAGVRIDPHTGVRTTAWPCGTLLASAWDPALAEQIGLAVGAETKENNLGMWLAPALNIHRNPLCGHNFEYYSEDPLLAGLTGAAVVQGVQKNGVSACIKHFACNNKETNRVHSDSRVSERALREIYLKPFEIIVKAADPWSLMTAYNAINGQRTSESKELITDILRGEWGYKGLVITDWSNRAEHYKEVLAGNDVKMPCGFADRLAEAEALDAVTRADYEACARRVLEFFLKLD